MRYRLYALVRCETPEAQLINQLRFKGSYGYRIEHFGDLLVSARVVSGMLDYAESESSEGSPVLNIQHDEPILWPSNRPRMVLQ